MFELGRSAEILDGLLVAFQVEVGQTAVEEIWIKHWIHGLGNKDGCPFNGLIIILQGPLVLLEAGVGEAPVQI